MPISSASPNIGFPTVLRDRRRSTIAIPNMTAPTYPKMANGAVTGCLFFGSLGSSSLHACVSSSGFVPWHSSSEHTAMFVLNSFDAFRPFSLPRRQHDWLGLFSAWLLWLCWLLLLALLAWALALLAFALLLGFGFGSVWALAGFGSAGFGCLGVCLYQGAGCGPAQAALWHSYTLVCFPSLEQALHVVAGFQVPALARGWVARGYAVQTLALESRVGNAQVVCLAVFVVVARCLGLAAKATFEVRIVVTQSLQAGVVGPSNDWTRRIRPVLLFYGIFAGHVAARLVLVARPLSILKALVGLATVVVHDNVGRELHTAPSRSPRRIGWIF